MAADGMTQKWWDVCMPCQEPLEDLMDFAESSLFAVTQQRSAGDWAVLSEVVEDKRLGPRHVLVVGGPGLKDVEPAVEPVLGVSAVGVAGVDPGKGPVAVRA